MFHPRFANNYSSTDLEDIFNSDYNRMSFSDEELEKMEKVFMAAEEYDIDSVKKYNKFLIETRREFKTECYSKIKLYRLYRTLLADGRINKNKGLEQFMKLKPPRGASGVNVITIFLPIKDFLITNLFNSITIIFYLLLLYLYYLVQLVFTLYFVYY